jgi:hypothetical protein
LPIAARFDAAIAFVIAIGKESPPTGRAKFREEGRSKSERPLLPPMIRRSRQGEIRSSMQFGATGDIFADASASLHRILWIAREGQPSRFDFV